MKLLSPCWSLLCFRMFTGKWGSMSSVEIQEENFDSKMIFLLFCFYSNVHEYILYIYYIYYACCCIHFVRDSFVPSLPFHCPKKNNVPDFPQENSPSRHLARCRFQICRLQSLTCLDACESMGAWVPPAPSKGHLMIRDHKPQIWTF